MPHDGAPTDDLERAQAALAKSEARLRFLLEHSSDIIVRVDADDRVTYVSPSCRRYGYEPEELIGRPGYEMLHPDDVPKLRRLIADLFSGAPEDRTADREQRLRAKDGSWVWMEGSPTIIRDDEGRPIEVVSFLRDISARKAVKAALAESEAKFRRFAENGSDVLLACTLDSKLTYASPSAQRVWGYAPDELIGKSAFALLEPEFRPAMAAYMAELTASGEPVAKTTFEYRARTKSGETVWIEARPSLTFDADGQVVGLQDFSRDITARKRAEEALAESEARFRRVTEASHDLVLGFDLWGRITYASPAARHFGYAPEDLIGRDCFALLHPDDVEIVRALNAALLKGEIAEEIGEYRVLSGSGDWVWVEGNPGVTRDETGRPIGFVNYLRDVTARHAAEAALADSEARYRLLSDMSTDIILRVDAQAVVQFVSPACRQLGYEPADMIGRSVDDFIHPDDLAPTRLRRAAVMAAQAAPPGVPREMRIRRKDGTWTWLEGSPSPILDAAGQASGFVSVLRDVSERRAMVDELRRKTAEAESAAVAKSEFLANMSHEIRTPLTGILGFSGLLTEVDGLPPRAEAFASRIATAGQTLLSVVNDILDFSKIEAGQIELDPQPFDPADFVAETIDLVAAQAEAKGLSLRLDLKGALPAAIEADGARMRQILLNLLTNAIKFTRTGGLTVAVRHHAGNGGSLRVSVTDTGAGIAPEHIGRLFQRFSQGDGSISRQYGGTGLGLAICKRLAELMGGSIGVESKVGEGSTFWFTIAAPVAAAPQADTALAFEADVKPARILIVDDVASNRELARVILEAFDHEISEASGGAEAVEAALQTPYDLILMDLQMPGMDGLAATRAIRATSDVNALTPIVALSANVMAEHLHACREAGLDDHVAKPIDAGELLGKVRRWTSGDADPLQRERVAP